VAWGQGATLAPFPLQVKRAPADFTAKSDEALQADFRRLLREAGVQVPNSFQLNTALGELKRQDCDRENQCLSLLAVKADTLYAMYVSVDFDLAKNVIVSGRVVRSDGVAVADTRTVQLALGKDTFAAVAKLLLGRLVKDELKVAALPAAKPVEVKPPEPTVVPDAGVPFIAPVEPVDAGVMTPPPPPPLEDSPLKTIGYVAAGVGGAAAVTGAILFGVGSGSVRAVNMNGAVVPSTGETPEAAVAAYKQAQALQPAGLVTLGLGAAIAAAGVVLILVAPSAPKVSVMPLQGGGAVVGIEGELP
jgi:hypothetical protein